MWSLNLEMSPLRVKRPSMNCRIWTLEFIRWFHGEVHDDELTLGDSGTRFVVDYQ